MLFIHNQPSSIRSFMCSYNTYRYILKHLPCEKIVMKWHFIWKNIMKCHSNYTRRRLRSSLCTINDMLFTSSGKHSIQLKYEMLEISFLIQLIESIHGTMYTDIIECRGLLPLPSTSNTRRLQLILQAVFSLKLQAIMKCQASCWCFETGTSCRDWNK